MAAGVWSKNSRDEAMRGTVTGFGWSKCAGMRGLYQGFLDQIVEEMRFGPKVFSRGSETLGVEMVIL